MTIPRSPLTDHADLFALWESIVGEPGFARRSLWLVFVDADNRPLDLVVPIDDIPEDVDIAGVRRLLDHLRGELSAGTIVTMLSRPGSGRVRESDREWARAVEDLLADQRPYWPVHLATDDGLRVLAPDDLLIPRSA
jgi:hypothetical protein